MEDNIKDKMDRLENVRADIEKHRSSKERLSGELNAGNKTFEGLEQKAKDKFDSGIDGLVDIKAELVKEADELLVKAEATLGANVN